MPYMNIDIDDFLSDCRRSDIQTIIKYLIEDGYEEDMIVALNENKIKFRVSDLYIDEALFKISNSQIQLTLEEENTINQIANRLV
jgi:hypothetical protein